MHQEKGQARLAWNRNGETGGGVFAVPNGLFVACGKSTRIQSTAQGKVERGQNQVVLRINLEKAK